MILVYFGEGKGKTSAALGGAFRALGHGWRVLVIHFMKGDWPVLFGELKSAERHPKLEMIQLGMGFVKIMGDKKPLELHKRAARCALDIAKKKMLSKKYDLIVLDEVLNALDTGQAKLIPKKELFALLKKCPRKTHLALTGRIRDVRTKEEIIARADLVTEMKEVKHPYQKGIPALKGIDF